MSDTTGSQGTFETRADAGKGDAGLVKFWLEAIDLAGKTEKTWRAEGEEAEAIYQSGTKLQPAAKRRFNILYSNTETLAAAIYNSTPIPDIRRRFAEQDDVSRHAATVLERCISYTLDQYDPDIVFRAVVKDGLLPGRGLVRVKLKPPEGNYPEQVTCEAVEWHSVRLGPALTWNDLPWLAFRHYLSRAEVEKISPDIGRALGMDHEIDDRPEQGKGDNVPDVFKRALVWEVWDKETRRVLFIAEGHKAEPLAVFDDPLQLAQFFPCPRPFMPVEVANQNCPIVPFKLYRALADELDELTVRISKITRALRWRGAYIDPKMGDFLTKFEDLDDGELAPLDNPTLAQGGIDKAFWFMPIKEAAETLQRLYEARESVKQAIYEVTGIADLLRGASMASETATAQNIKAQWGALRVSTMQAEVQRMVRDVIRLKVEIIAEHFRPETIQAISGMPLTPEVLQMLQSDPLRRYRVDVETDSTIRADLQRQQQNIAQFVQGFGSFIQSVGPAVQAGAMPMNVVTEMVKSFSRVFKLGRAVEEALDSLPMQAPQQADPNAGAQAQAQAEMQAKQMEMQSKMEAEQAKLQADMQAKQMELQAKSEADQARLAFEMQKHADQMQIEREKLALDAAARATDHDMRQADFEKSHSFNERKFAFDTASAGMRERDTGEFQTDEQADNEAELALKAEMTEAVKRQADAADQLVALVQKVGASLAAPKRVVRDQRGNAIAIEPQVMN